MSGVSLGDKVAQTNISSQRTLSEKKEELGVKTKRFPLHTQTVKWCFFWGKKFFTLHHLFIPSTPASWILHFPSTNQATLCLNHPAEDVKSETFSSSPPPTPAQMLRCVFTFLKESSCCIILKSAFVDGGGGGGRRVGETTPGQKKSPWSRRWESPRRWA